MKKDTPIEEIIELMKAGEGFFTYQDVEVIQTNGRPVSTDSNGYSYKTYAISTLDDKDNKYLERQFCHMILGNLYSIACQKPEGQEINRRPIHIVWRQTMEIDEMSYDWNNEKKEFVEPDIKKRQINGRCLFYVANPPSVAWVFVN